MEAASLQVVDPLGDLVLGPEERENERADKVRRGELSEADAQVEREREAADQAALAAEQEQLDGEDDGKVVSLQVEAGETVGAMPAADPEPDPGMIPPDQIIVHGTAEKARKWSGKAPSEVVISLTGVKFAAEGSFETGDVFRFSGAARVISEGKKDKLDKDTKAVVDAVQEHSAVVLDFAIE